MTEEAKPAETPAPVAAPATEPPKPEPPKDTKPPGYYPVDFDNLGLSPEQRAAIEPRVRYLYGNLKAGEKERAELRKYNDDLQRAIDERLTPLEKDREQARDVNLTVALKQARDTGDIQTEAAILKELAKPAPPKPEPKQQNEFWKGPVESWAAEADHEGNLRRPWLDPAHPEHELALGRVHKLNQEWQSQGLQINQSTLPLFLQQLDARMVKANGARPTAAVLPTGQAKPPAPKASDLTEEEKYFADRSMQHIKDPAERYRRYASQKALMRRA